MTATAATYFCSKVPDYFFEDEKNVCFHVGAQNTNGLLIDISFFDYTEYETVFHSARSSANENNEDFTRSLLSGNPFLQYDTAHEEHHNRRPEDVSITVDFNSLDI